MISQKFPVGGMGEASATRRLQPAATGFASAAKVSAMQGVTGRNGPVRIELHAAPRCEGARVDPGLLSRGAGARRLRRTLLLSGAGPAGGGHRRQRAALRDRDTDRE